MSRGRNTGTGFTICRGPHVLHSAGGHRPIFSEVVPSPHTHMVSVPIFRGRGSTQKQPRPYLNCFNPPIDPRCTAGIGVKLALVIKKIGSRQLEIARTHTVAQKFFSVGAK